MGIFNEERPVIGKAEDTEITDKDPKPFFRIDPAKMPRTFYIHEPEPPFEERVRLPRASYPNTIGLRIMDESSFPDLSINHQRQISGMPTFAEAHGLVEHDYTMDPETDDVVFACDIQPGMVVLQQDDKLSLRLTEVLGSLLGAKISNRWCKVGKVLTSDFGVISFISQYDDGLKVVRHSVGHKGWFVKKDSIPVVEEVPVSSEVTLECLRYGYQGLDSCRGSVRPRIYNNSDEPFVCCEAHHEMNLSRGWNN